MIAAKCEADYNAELKQLFASFNLRGDGMIHKDEFKLAQSALETNKQACPPAPDVAKSPPRCSLAVKTLTLHELRVKPGKALRSPSEGRTSAVNVARSRRTRSVVGRPTPSQVDRKSTPSPNDLQKAMLRSPSVDKFGKCDFQNVDVDGDNVISFEDFKRWQLSLLEASQKSSSTKRHRLVCLAQELKRCNKEQLHSWRECSKALDAAATSLPVNLNALEKALAMSHDLGMHDNLDSYKQSLMAALETEALAQAMRRDVTPKMALSIIENAKQRAKKAGIKVELFLEHEHHIREWRESMRDECLSVLSGAASAHQLAPLFKEMTKFLPEHDLAVFKEKLAEMQKPFEVHVATMAGQSCSLQVSRSQCVWSLKEQVAAHFAVQTYRITLVCEMGRLEPDSEVLENFGVVSTDVQITVILAAEDRWQEVPLEEVLVAWAARSSAGRAEVRDCRARLAKGDLSKEDCRAIFAPRLKALDDEDAEIRHLAEKAEAEKRQRAEETAAAMRRQGEESQAAIRTRCNCLDFKTLCNQAVHCGILSSSQEQSMQKLTSGTETRARLVEYVALHQSIDEERVHVKHAQERVVADETEAQEGTARLTEITNDAQADLDEALPAMDATERALNNLNKADICELKAFAKPPLLCQMTLEAVCILFQQQPNWDNGKKLLNDIHFLNRLRDFDKDDIPRRVMDRLQVYINNDEFRPDVVGRCSRACQALCMWVRSIEMYDRVAQIIHPKRRALQEAERALKAATGKYRQSQETLKVVLQTIEMLQRKLDTLGPFSLVNESLE